MTNSHRSFLSEEEEPYQKGTLQPCSVSDSKFGLYIDKEGEADAETEDGDDGEDDSGKEEESPRRQ